jgi:hypothetical protein
MIKPLAEDLAYVFARKLFQEHHAPYCYSRVPQFNWASEELENGTNVWCDTMFLRLEHGYICCFALTIDDDQYRRSHVALLGTMQAACLLLGPRDNGADLLLKILPHIELDGISEEDHRFIDETIDEVFDSDTEIMSCVSNNHLVSEKFYIRSKISRIRKGDHIRIKGYLISLNCDGETLWSSTVRDDTGMKANNEGSCEIIYVTDVRWLP